MSVVKVIELISEGDSIESAMKSAVTEAGQTLTNIKQINIEHIEGLVDKNQIVKYRVHAKISFLIERK